MELIVEALIDRLVYLKALQREKNRKYLYVDNNQHPYFSYRDSDSKETEKLYILHTEIISTNFVSYNEYYLYFTNDGFIRNYNGKLIMKYFDGFIYNYDDLITNLKKFKLIENYVCQCKNCQNVIKDTPTTTLDESTDSEEWD